METAIRITPDLVRAVIEVRKTINGQDALRDEEWSSLTKHVGEVAVCAALSFLKASSNDSVVDAINPCDGFTDEINFSDLDEVSREMLVQRGVQIKCRRTKNDSKPGATGNVNLKSPFAELYAVWLDENYLVDRVFRLSRDQVVQIVQSRKQGKNQSKLPYARVLSVGQDMSATVRDLSEWILEADKKMPACPPIDA